MNNLRNRAQLIGNLGMDPEVKEINGKTLVKVSLATTESYKDSDGKKVKTTQWHNLVAWGNTALVFKNYAKKGNEVAIEGKINYRNYESKEGEKKYITEIIVSEVLLLNSKK